MGTVANLTKTIDKNLAKKIVENSGYTLDEIKSEFPTGKSYSYKQGFWASRGIAWRLGMFVEKTLLS